MCIWRKNRQYKCPEVGHNLVCLGNANEVDVAAAAGGREKVQ